MERAIVELNRAVNEVSTGVQCLTFFNLRTNRHLRDVPMEFDWNRSSCVVFFLRQFFFLLVAGDWPKSATGGRFARPNLVVAGTMRRSARENAERVFRGSRACPFKVGIIGEIFPETSFRPASKQVPAGRM